jgi:murein L,D-transpeptidase YafK
MPERRPQTEACPAQRSRLPHALAFLALALAPLPGRAATESPTPETQLLTAIGAMQSGDLGGAMKDLQDLVKREPNFRLAHLLYGQLLAARSGTPGLTPLADEQDPRVRELLDEYRARIAEAKAAPAPGTLPDSILKLSEASRYAIAVDLSRARLYVLENDRGGLRLIRDNYATLARNGYGKQAAGDLRTPVGIYWATGFTPGASLPPFYGAGAFPLNYPNSWDRVHGRTGSGIWLHGVPRDTYARPPRASEGCVVLPNDDLLALKPLLAPENTPIIFSDRIDWLPAAQVKSARETLEKRINAWRRWSERDTERYLSFYAEDFKTDDGMSRAAFAAYKRQVNESRRHIKVQIRGLNLFSYPGEHGLVLAQFTQDYKSNNYSTSGRKDQYWRQQSDGQWKIVREEAHSAADAAALDSAPFGAQ